MILFAIAPASALEPSATPSMAIALWLHTYPDNLEQAVELTTPHMRHFLSPHQWVAMMQRRLSQTEFRYLERAIVSVRSTGSQSTVVVHASVRTHGQTTHQQEHYILRPFCTTWLIDSVDIVSNGRNPVEDTRRTPVPRLH